MSKKQDRREIVRKVKDAALLYKRHLVGKRFMYVFDGRYIEVIFKSENFRHLTGVGTVLSSKQFYKYAVTKKLAESQICFGPNHPYDLCTRKMRHIYDIATITRSECFMLEEIKTDSMTYKFGTTDLKFTLCLNKDIYGKGKDNECYIAQSLRDGDCFSKSEGAYVVTHIFSRKNDRKRYTDLLYMDDSSSMEALSEEIKSLLDPKYFPLP